MATARGPLSLDMTKPGTMAGLFKLRTLRGTLPGPQRIQSRQWDVSCRRDNAGDAPECFDEIQTRRPIRVKRAEQLGGLIPSVFGRLRAPDLGEAELLGIDIQFPLIEGTDVLLEP